MPKKRKFSKGKPVALADFFGMHHNPAVETGYSSDDEHEESRAWAAERDRQKIASREAAALGQRKAQVAVLLGEENDHRANLTSNQKNTRTRLEEAISEQRVDREWIEFQIALREEREQQALAKKVPFTQVATQQMFHRANIADKETEGRISFFNSFAASANKAKDAEKARGAKEKLEADRKKAAERAKAFEERARKANTEKPNLFQLVNAPAEPTAPETKQAGGWLSGWFSKS
jgi:hypothetical protein